MSQTVEINQGELKVNYPSILNGKTSLKALGFSDKNLEFESGLLRLVFNFEGISNHAYFKMPTIEISYKEEMDETHWQCDFNEELGKGNNELISSYREKAFDTCLKCEGNSCKINAFAPKSPNDNICKHLFLYLFTR